MPERSRLNISKSTEVPTDSPEVLRARAQVVAALKEFPIRIKPESADLDQWTAFCQIQSQSHGKTSVLTLLPDISDRVITRTMRSMIIRNRIATYTDLLNLDPEKIIELKGIGPKSVPLISAMRNLALAQLQ